MRLDDNKQVFFELVRSGLWTNANLSDNLFEGVDWGEVYRLAEEQSVVGLVTAGIENVNANLKVPQEWTLRFIGATLQIEQQNKAMNAFVAQLIERLRENDIYALLVPFEKLSSVRRMGFFFVMIRCGYKVYYLVIDGHIVGYSVVTPAGRRLKMSTKDDIVIGPYYIAPKYRGRGYATKMIQMTLNSCTYSFKFAYDWILKSNIGNIRASEACGFKQCGTLIIIGKMRNLVEEDNGPFYTYRYENEKFIKSS